MSRFVMGLVGSLFLMIGNTWMVLFLVRDIVFRVGCGVMHLCQVAIFNCGNTQITVLVVSLKWFVVELMVFFMITVSVDLGCVIGCILWRGRCCLLIILMVWMRNLVLFAMERHGLVSQIVMLGSTLCPGFNLVEKFVILVFNSLHELCTILLRDIMSV